MDARASTHTRTYIYTQHAHATYARIHPSRAQVLLSDMKLLPVLLLLLLLLLQLLLLLHALEGDWPPSHHHFSKHPEQSNPKEHFQRGFLLPVPSPLFSSCPGLLYSIIEFSPGSPECNIYFITGVPEPGVSDH